MSEILKADSLTWESIRPDVAAGVYGQTLLDDHVKIVLTRVARGGKFALHRDDYGHLFYFLSGAGSVRVADKESAASAGLMVRVVAGEEHAYENTGMEDLMLISVNLPDREKR